ncbi:MAG: hypothetical protein ACYC3S_10525 [Chloroflexota bacterium]
MKGTIRRAEELEWVDLPNYFSALSKMLITPDNSESKNVDVLISSYAPKGFAAEHYHEESENIFYFTSGRGLFIHGWRAYSH